MADVSVTITKKAYKGNAVGSTVTLPSPRAKLLVGLGRAAYADAAPTPVNNTPTSRRASAPVAGEDASETTGTKPAAKRAPAKSGAAKKTASARKPAAGKTGGKAAGYSTRAMKAAK